MANYAYSPRHTMMMPSDLPSYNSPSYNAYRDTSRRGSPAVSPHSVHRDTKQQMKQVGSYGRQDYPTRSSNMMGARKELPFKNPAWGDFEPEFVSVGGMKNTGFDDSLQSDRIQNSLLDEICSDYGIKDSIELDLFNLDATYPKMTRLPDLEEADQMIPFGAYEADAELKNTREGQYATRGGMGEGNVRKINRDEQIMPPPISAGVKRTNGRPHGNMMARVPAPVYPHYQQWSGNTASMPGKQGNGICAGNSGGNWGNDIIEAVASPTISSTCETEQKPTIATNAPDSTCASVLNRCDGITEVHSTTNCSTATSSTLPTSALNSGAVTDEEKLSDVQKSVEYTGVFDKENELSELGEFTSDVLLHPVKKELLRAEEEKGKGDTGNEIYRDMDSKRLDLGANTGVTNESKVTNDRQAATEASQMSSAATSASTSPSQMHAAKKQRTCISSGSELLEEVRECFAYVHGVDMFSAPNQHTSFGDPLFTVGANNTNTQMNAGYGYYGNTQTADNADNMKGYASSNAQGYNYYVNEASGQKYRDCSPYPGQTNMYNMQQQAVSAPCTPSKHGSDGYTMWISHAGVSGMTPSRAMAGNRGTNTADMGYMERGMYGSHPMLNRNPARPGSGFNAGMMQASSQPAMQDAGYEPNSYRGLLKSEQPLSRVQNAGEVPRTASPYKMKGELDQTRQAYPTQQQHYQIQQDSMSHSYQNYPVQQGQEAVYNSSRQGQEAVYNSSRQGQEAGYNSSQQLSGYHQQAMQQQRPGYDSYQQQYYNMNPAEQQQQLAGPTSDQMPLSQNSFLRRLISGDPANKIFRQHSLFPLLRDLIIADMNFHTPTFPFRLIANLPTEFPKLIANYQSRNPGLSMEHPDPTVNGVVMDAVKYAHAALIGKIQSRKASEGYVDRPRENMDDFCESFQRSVKRTNMPGSYDPTSPTAGMPGSDPSLPHPVSRSPSLPNLPYSCVPDPAATGYLGQPGPPGYMEDLHYPYPRCGGGMMDPNIHRGVGGYGMSEYNYNTPPPAHTATPPHMFYMGDRLMMRGPGSMHSLPSSPSKLQYRSMADIGLVPGQGFNSGEKAGKNKVLPKEAVNIMLEWLREHQENPYPNDDEKESLIETTKLTINQINYWFTNARRRILPKWALQRHMAEQEKAREKNNGSGSSDGKSERTRDKMSGVKSECLDDIRLECTAAS